MGLFKQMKDMKKTVPQVQLATLRPGAALRVKVDPENPSAVWIDFAGA